MNKISFIYLSTCKPCKTIMPEWDRLSKEFGNHENLEFEKLDGNEVSYEFKIKHDLRSTPVFLIIDENDRVTKELGNSGFQNIKKRVKELANG